MVYVASTFRRIIAHIFDEVIGSVFWIPLLIAAFSSLGKNQEILLPWILVFSVWIARMAYEIICIYILQALPGQYFLGLTIKSTHQPELGLSLFQTLIRVLFAQLKYVLGPSIYFMALFHRERQHIGDILAETRVVQDQERNLAPKARYFIGSIIVYISLTTNLGEFVEHLNQNKFNVSGLKIELPQFKLELTDF